MERWAAIAGYEGIYEVSDHGRVRSLPRRDRIGHPWHGRILKAAHDRKGYMYVSLCRDSDHHSVKVHRLVAEAFLPPSTPDRSHVNHMDLNPANNHFSNLEWVTPRENIVHAAAHGRFSALINRNARRALSPDLVRSIKADIAAGKMQHRDIAARYGVSLGTVARIRYGTHWVTPQAVDTASHPDADALVGMQALPLKSIKITPDLLQRILYDIQVLRLPQREIAARHGVGQQTVSRVNRGILPRTVRNITATKDQGHVKA